MALNYAEYLKIESLLSLQQEQSDPAEHDELLFIVIHQVYELWFKQLLHEVDRTKVQFAEGDLFGVTATFKRVRTILKTLVGQLDILETMTPLSFSTFRKLLDTASGFQSTQFRELEFVLGYKRPEAIGHLQPDWYGYDRVQRRLAEPSVVDHFYDFLAGHGVEIPEGLRHPQPPQATRPDRTVQAGLLRLFRERGEMAILFESMADVDEGLQEWRYRHVKIVERTIGRKRGTGGSAGMEFLKKSLFHAVFPDLWEIRQDM